jgi:hypothetical protein
MFKDTAEARKLLTGNWKQDATHFLGIPIHPLGQLDGFEYVNQETNDPAVVRHRLQSMFIHTFSGAAILCIFLHNALFSIKLVCQRPRILAGWCCLVQAIAGVIFSLSMLLMVVPGVLHCVQVQWIYAVCLCASPVCVGAVLLQKAYLVHNRNKWLLAIGVLLLLPQPMNIYSIWSSPILMVSSGGCIIVYPDYFPWLKLVTDAPINIVFSVAFLIVVHRQCKQFGSDIWHRLESSGLQIMCLIICSNKICTVGAVLHIAGSYSRLFITIDWVTNSLLLVWHCATIRSIDGSNRPDTSHALHGFSQIPTALSKPESVVMHSSRCVSVASFAQNFSIYSKEQLLEKSSASVGSFSQNNDVS